MSYSKSFEQLSRPHVYAVAQTAYRQMKATQVDQTILVSGLSGSGKTETVKFTIHYLSTIAGGGHGTLEQQINVSGLLLESFGNATTVLNANSSRFGKYTRIYFGQNGLMAGAEIKTCTGERTPFPSLSNLSSLYVRLAGEIARLQCAGQRKKLPHLLPALERPD